MCCIVIFEKDELVWCVYIYIYIYIYIYTYYKCVYIYSDDNNGLVVPGVVHAGPEERVEGAQPHRLAQRLVIAGLFLVQYIYIYRERERERERERCVYIYIYAYIYICV